MVRGGSRRKSIEGVERKRATRGSGARRLTFDAVNVPGGDNHAVRGWFFGIAGNRDRVNKVRDEIVAIGNTRSR